MSAVIVRAADLKVGQRFRWMNQTWSVLERHSQTLVVLAAGGSQSYRHTPTMHEKVALVSDAILSTREDEPEWAARLVFMVDHVTGERRSKNMPQAEALAKMRTYTAGTLKRLDLVDVETDRFLSWAI